MYTTTRGIVAMFASFAFVTLISLQPVMAAQAPAAAPAAQAESQKAETAKGELQSVDAAKKTLTVAVEGGAQQTFMYTDTTKVSGAQGGVEGLASMSGRQVTVEYMMKGADRIASMIDVAAK
jgi:hypothetical protein